MVIAPEMMALLRAYAWPGNVRELKNVVVRWLRFAPQQVITPTDLPPEIHGTEKDSAGLKTLKQEREKESIIAALQKSGGSVSRAAQALSVSRVTLYRKIKEHHLSAR